MNTKKSWIPPPFPRRDQLLPKFGGVIKEEASESTPWWPPRIVPPKGGPNVLLIMTDDQGFGAPSGIDGNRGTEPLRDATAVLRHFLHLLSHNSLSAV